MLKSFHQTRHLCAKLILGLVLLLVVACAPTSPTPNQLTSVDTIGEIVVRYPDDWTDYVENPSAERQGVTIVRAEQSAVQNGVDLTTLPVIRLSYDRRSDTPLKDNLPLAEYAVRLIAEQLPNVTFDQPQNRQISSRAAVAFQGVDSATNLNYLYTVVDYISEGGVLVAVLTAPGNLSTYNSAYDLTLANTRITVRSVPPTTTPPPESTADLPSSGTDEATSEADATTPIAPESSAEVQPTLINPESTAELTPSPQETSEATAEVTTGTAATIGSGTVTLGRGIQLQSPEGWTVSSNNQTNVTLTDGLQTADALLLDQMLPAGQGLISVEIGTLEEVFRQPFNGFNPERWLTNELGSIVTQGGETAEATEIQTIILDEEVLGLGALVTMPQYDRYIIVGQLGNSLYKRVQLYTAPGEFADYEPVLLQVTDSIQLAQN